MKLGGGAIVVRALEDEGIGFAFGIPGTHNIELYDALAETKQVRTVLVTDEQSASFMADGVWRASGAMACANVVPGAGLTHAMSGIGEAFLDNVPMLVLGCGIRRDTLKAFQLHDVDQQTIARAVTKGQFRPQDGLELYATIRRACALAREGAPGPVFVEVPANLYLFQHDFEEPGSGIRGPGSVPGRADPGPTPDPDSLTRAVVLLGRAKRPLLYVGAGAAAAGEKLVALAERLEAPVATTFQGKGVFPETHPLALWPGFGAAAPPFARQTADRCDATLAIGCRFGEVATGSYGLAVPRPLIHADIDPDVIGRNYPADSAVVADARLVVDALLEALPPRPRDDALRAAIRAGHEAVERDWEGTATTGRVSPFRLLSALQARFGPETIFTADSGNGTFLAMEMLRLERPRKFLAPVDYSCMGYAVPSAIGAKLARPECPVVALAGDGAFLMTGLELLTAAHQGAAVAVFVLRDGELAQIAQFQDVALGRRTASEVPSYALADISRGLGVECLALERDEQIAQVLDRVAAITAAGKPVVVDTAIDYSGKTYFTRGVVKTTFLRLPWLDRLRFVGRALTRKVTAR